MEIGALWRWVKGRFGASSKGYGKGKGNGKGYGYKDYFNNYQSSNKGQEIIKEKDKANITIIKEITIIQKEKATAEENARNPKVRAKEKERVIIKEKLTMDQHL